MSASFDIGARSRVIAGVLIIQTITPIDYDDFVSLFRGVINTQNLC